MLQEWRYSAVYRVLLDGMCREKGIKHHFDITYYEFKKFELEFHKEKQQ